MLDRLSLSQDRQEEQQQQEPQQPGSVAAAATAARPAAATSAEQPVRLLVFFLNRLLNFRHAELEALVTLDAAPPHGGGGPAGASPPRVAPPPPPPPLVPSPPSPSPPLPPTTQTPTTFDMRWELPHGGDRLSPFWHATFPSERAARRAAERAALTRGVFEPWAEASTMEELESKLRALPDELRAPWASRDPGTRSFKLMVEGWGARMPDAARRSATFRALAAAGLRSRVDLASPDDVFWLIVAPGNVDEGWTVDGEGAKAAVAGGQERGDEEDGGARAAAAAAADAPDSAAGGKKKPGCCPKAGEQWYLDMFGRDGDSDQGTTPRPVPRHPNQNTLPYRAPTRLYFCRQVACCDRTATVTRYNLNERPYIGPTSMDPEMAAVMANAARTKQGQLALDPFCGTGSILVALAAAGARVVGADIDVKVLRDGHAADGNAAAALARRRPKNAPKRRTAKRQAAKAAAAKAAASGEGAPVPTDAPTDAPTTTEAKTPVASDVLSNFEYYGLGPRLVDLVRLDAHRPLLRINLPPMFDALVADPPYGVRAGGRKSERVENSSVRDRATHVSKTFSYSLTECLEDLLDLAARLLKPGGRLVYFMPAVVPGGEAAEAAKAAVLAARAREGAGRGGGGGEASLCRGEGGGGQEGRGAEEGCGGGGGRESSGGGRREGRADDAASSSGGGSDDSDDEDDDEDALLGREPPTHPCLEHVATCEQVLSSRYARRLVVMERNAKPFSAEEAREHRALGRNKLAALSDGLMAAVRLPRAPKVTRKERRARKSAIAGEGLGHRGKHV
jgi:tRNA G10  N-methylase Trm11